MNKNNSLLLGAHISTAGGFDKAIARAESIGCTALQIFTKNNRQWAAKPISDKEAADFKNALAGSSVRSLMAHATYLINIGSNQKDTLAQSLTLLIEELKRCDQLDIPYLILHPGSYGSGDTEQCLATIATSLDHVFDQYNGNTMLLLENMAGQGSSVCYSFEHLAQIRAHVHHKRSIGICFDTCHAFAAGYDMRTADTYEEVWNTFDALIGLSNLKAFHINDSKKPLGSHVDRHANIGQGALGLDAFRFLFNDPRFFDIPKILETPSDSDDQEEILGQYAENMKIIRDLL